jgi:tetratricopeptide (TPR) repeat protein
MDNPSIQTAASHYQAGRLDFAEDIYRKLLAKNPHDPDALFLLGALLAQRGDVQRAIDLHRRAIAVKPDYLKAIRNLAALLAGAARFEESVTAFKSAMAIAPQDPALRNDLGTVYLVMNRLDDAIASFQAAIELNPDFAEAFRNLSVAFRGKKQTEDAIRAATNAVRIAPSVASAHIELGRSLLNARRFQDAMQNFRQALICKPDDSDAYEGIAKCFSAMERFDDAIAALKRAVELCPNRSSLHLALGITAGNALRHQEALSAFQEVVRVDPNLLDGYVNCALALAKLKRFEEAAEYQAKARALDPNAGITHLAAGQIAFQRFDVENAIEHYRDAVAADPNHASAWCELGRALIADGQFEEAQTAYRRAVTIEPSLVGMFDNIVRTGKGVVEGHELDAFMKAAAQSESEEQLAAEFALGKVLDDKEQFDEAFEHYARGNLISKRRHEALGYRYSASSYREMVDQMIEIFTPEFYQQRRGCGNPSDLPVFIVGMPRSGTTLAHQVIASHPQAYGAGERGDIRDLVTRLSRGGIRESAQHWSTDAVTKAANEQMEAYRRLSGGAIRLVDKLPNNVKYCGLIPLLFPNTHIIFCRRDPRDTCLSCFFQNFEVGVTFATDLANCGSHNVQTYRLIDHWLKVLPVKMMELQYEAVVAHLETEARRLINFVGLPWDPSCLNYREAKTAVLTSSAWQVRQPIYNSSVGRWRHYEKHLGPLLKELEKLPKM